MNAKIFESDCDDIITGLDTEEMVSANAFVGMAVRAAKKYPLLFIPTFIEDFIQGMFSSKMIRKYDMLNHNNFASLVNSIKMNLKRDKDLHLGVKDKNLQDPDQYDRYQFLSKYTNLLHEPLENLLNYNILQALVSYSVLQHTYLTSEGLHDRVMDTYAATKNDIEILHDKDRVASFEEYIRHDVRMKIRDVVSGLYEQGHVVVRDGDVSVTSEYPKFAEHVYDFIRHAKNGISYAALQRKVFGKFPLFRLAVSNVQIFENILHGLESRNLLARKKSFWKYSPANDQLFTLENYDAVVTKMSAQAVKSGRTKFFGREIRPELFLDELKSLEYGDLDDEDDQVTRIAGLVLSDAVMLQSPRENMEEFDFVVDLENYNFRPEQEKIMQELNFRVNSTIFHCKVMIGEDVTPSVLSRLASVLPAGEQGVILTCKPISRAVSKITADDKTIQIIGEDAIRSWCAITPVIPCRKNSVAKIMYGDDAGKAVLVKSLNYESGLATTETIPDGSEILVPIGSIEEMLPNVSSLDDFEAISDRYSKFLNLLAEAAPDNFEAGIKLRPLSIHTDPKELIKSISPELFDSSGRYFGGSTYDDILSSTRLLYKTWYVRFENVHATITASDNLRHSRCTCGHSLNENNYRTLCPHLVAGLDIVCKGDLGDGETVANNTSRFIAALEQFRFDNINRSIDMISYALSPKHRGVLESYLSGCANRL